MTLQEENEKLRGLLNECRPILEENGYWTFSEAIEITLSQQAMPHSDGMCGSLENPDQRCICREEFGYRVCKAEPAPAQDEREAALESIIRAQRKSLDICASQIAALQTTRPAQTDLHERAEFSEALRLLELSHTVQGVDTKTVRAFLDRHRAALTAQEKA